MHLILKQHKIGNNPDHKTIFFIYFSFKKLLFKVINVKQVIDNMFSLLCHCNNVPLSLEILCYC